MHEFTTQISDLRSNLGFTVREVALSGNPVIVRRYDREEVILVPLAEWRRLQDTTGVRSGIIGPCCGSHSVRASQRPLR
ncbi:MAG: type II toxin-antitoxin system Phd/YefM family antitoxin [Planctomycetota bacterium]|nr:MAG: type II toxin-antitoxin system Phd/YefM family antitoxin [Planctomycetota bacterium]